VAHCFVHRHVSAFGFFSSAPAMKSTDERRFDPAVSFATGV
jgi:hypothetical protein